LSQPTAGDSIRRPNFLTAGEFQPFLTSAALPQGRSASIFGIQELGDAQQRPDPELSPCATAGLDAVDPCAVFLPDKNPR